GAAIGDEMFRGAHAAERLCSELGWRHESQADVRQIRAHVVEEKIRVGKEFLPVEGPHGILSRPQRREMARSAPDAIEETTAPSGGAVLPQGRRWRQEPHDIACEIERLLVELRFGRGIHTLRY